jgi:ribonuclease HI
MVTAGVNNTQGKTVKVIDNNGYLGQYETAIDSEMEAFADIMDFANQNVIPRDLTINSDAQPAIARVGHTGIGLGSNRVIRIVQVMQNRIERGWRMSFEWVLGHSGVEGNDRADKLTSEAVAE